MRTTTSTTSGAHAPRVRADGLEGSETAPAKDAVPSGGTAPADAQPATKALFPDAGEVAHED